MDGKMIKKNGNGAQKHMVITQLQLADGYEKCNWKHRTD